MPDGRLVRRVALGAVLMILLAGAAGFGLWLAGRDAAPVRLAVFSQALADPDSEQVKRLVEELAAVESRISVLSYNFVLDKAKVEALRIQRTPAIAILGAEKDYGIRMYGLPSGYEFGTLVDAIVDVSGGQSGLGMEEGGEGSFGFRRTRSGPDG